MNKDKIIIGIIITGMMIISLLSWLPPIEISNVIRTAIGAIFCLFLYLGYNWARWVVGTLSALGTLMLAVSLVACFLAEPGELFGSLNDPTVIAITSIMLIFYAFSSFYLLNPKLLRSHFKH